MSRTSRLHLEPDALRRAAADLQHAGAQYDTGATSVPPAGTGPAAPLVALALGAHLEAAALVVSDARVLGLAVEAARTDVEVVDARTALDLFSVDDPSTALAS